MYKGDAPCAGCGKTGAEQPRKSKDALCFECRDLLLLGRQFSDHCTRIHSSFIIPELSIMTAQWYSIRIRSIEQSFISLLKSFCHFDTRFVNRGYQFNRGILFGSVDAFTASHTLILPNETIEYASELAKRLISFCNELDKERENYKRELDELLKTQKNDIYNQGIEHGRNLLAQLNSGEITVEEMNKRFEKF